MSPSNDSVRRLNDSLLPTDNPEVLRIIAFGPPYAVNHHIMRMYQLGYAQPHEWSKPLPTVNTNEIMCIMTKRVMGLES